MSEINFLHFLLCGINENVQLENFMKEFHFQVCGMIEKREQLCEWVREELMEAEKTAEIRKGDRGGWRKCLFSRFLIQLDDVLCTAFLIIHHDF